MRPRRGVNSTAAGGADRAGGRSEAALTVRRTTKVDSGAKAQGPRGRRTVHEPDNHWVRVRRKVDLGQARRGLEGASPGYVRAAGLVRRPPDALVPRPLQLPRAGRERPERGGGGGHVVAEPAASQVLPDLGHVLPPVPGLLRRQRPHPGRLPPRGVRLRASVLRVWGAGNTPQPLADPGPGDHEEGAGHGARDAEGLAGGDPGAHEGQPPRARPVAGEGRRATCWSGSTGSSSSLRSGTSS